MRIIACITIAAVSELHGGSFSTSSGSFYSILKSSSRSLYKRWREEDTISILSSWEGAFSPLELDLTTPPQKKRKAIPPLRELR